MDIRLLLFHTCTAYLSLMMQDAYLPTMQEDLLQEVKKAGGGTYYGKICYVYVTLCNLV